MTWRGSTSVKDRIVSCLPYAFPMVEAMGFGMLLLTQFPILGLILIPLTPFLAVYSLLNSVLGGYGGLVIFFALYMLVVRNTNINHFIRYNTMNALIIGIAASLVSTVLSLLGILRNITLPLPLPLTILFSVVFLGVLISSVYSIVVALMGKYAEIPVLSEAAYSQTRY
jgi:hypothetical protein